MGKRGKDRLDINGGKIFRSSKSSGLERSGDVHIRMYSSSVSSNASSPLGLKGICSSFIGLLGSSRPSDPHALCAAELFPEN